MFGLGKKARAAEAIRRGVRASLTGAYFHQDVIAEFGLNEEASAWLYTEALSHQLYGLGCACSRAFGRTERWATYDFFFDSVVRAMKEYERSGGTSSASLAPVLLRRYTEFDALTGEQRVAGRHFEESAKLVCQQDSRANARELATALSRSTNHYIADVRKMFGV